MEARGQLRGTGISKAFVAFVLVVMAAAVGMVAADVTGSLSGTSAQGRITSGQVGAGPAWDYRATRGGIQLVDNPPATAAVLSPDAQERNQTINYLRIAANRPGRGQR